MARVRVRYDFLLWTLSVASLYAYSTELPLSTFDYLFRLVNLYSVYLIGLTYRVKLLACLE